MFDPLRSTSSAFCLMPQGGEDFFHGDEPVETNFVGEWEERLEAVAERQEVLLLLVSPPGAGKTHLVETTIMARAEHHGRRTQRIDCSNDELVELSLTYILNRKFPGETKCVHGFCGGLALCCERQPGTKRVLWSVHMALTFLLLLHRSKK